MTERRQQLEQHLDHFYCEVVENLDHEERLPFLCLPYSDEFKQEVRALREDGRAISHSEAWGILCLIDKNAKLRRGGMSPEAIREFWEQATGFEEYER